MGLKQANKSYGSKVVKSFFQIYFCFGQKDKSHLIWLDHPFLVVFKGKDRVKKNWEISHG